MTESRRERERGREGDSSGSELRFGSLGERVRDGERRTGGALAGEWEVTTYL